MSISVRSPTVRPNNVIFMIRKQELIHNTIFMYLQYFSVFLFFLVAYPIIAHKITAIIINHITLLKDQQ